MVLASVLGRRVGLQRQQPLHGHQAESGTSPGKRQTAGIAWSRPRQGWRRRRARRSKLSSTRSMCRSRRRSMTCSEGLAAAGQVSPILGARRSPNSLTTGHRRRRADERRIVAVTPGASCLSSRGARAASCPCLPGRRWTPAGNPPCERRDCDPAQLERCARQSLRLPGATAGGPPPAAPPAGWPGPVVQRLDSAPGGSPRSRALTFGETAEGPARTRNLTAPRKPGHVRP